MYIIEVSLIVIIILFLFSFFRKKEWYVVEWRMFSSPSSKIISYMLSDMGYSINEQYKNRITFKDKEGSDIIFEQWVFSDYSAAQKKFDELKDVIGGSSGVEKAFIRRQIARTRSGAYRLPPKYTELNDDIECALLETYPHFDSWTIPDKPSLYIQRMTKEDQPV